MPWTVLSENKALGKAHFSGTFATLEDAKAYAETQALRVRSFVTLEVWSGTPKNPIKPTGYRVSGS